MFCVINGNHDINNDDNGRDFSSGKAEHTDLVDPLEFKELYADCGYDDAVAMFDEGGSQGGSLSYVVRPAKGVTLIVVDSGKYSADQNGLGRDEHVTSGVVGGEAARVGGEPGQAGPRGRGHRARDPAPWRDSALLHGARAHGRVPGR